MAIFVSSYEFGCFQKEYVSRQSALAIVAHLQKVSGTGSTGSLAYFQQLYIQTRVVGNLKYLNTV